MIKMKKTRKNLLIFIATLLLSVASIFAQNGTTGQLIWSISDGTLTISPISEEGAMLDYHSSENQAPWRAFSNSFTTVIIENGVTNIGQYAFCNCINLISVIIGNSVTTIDFRAFTGCGLTGTLTIPSSVTIIGDDAFADCSNITSIEVNTNNPNYSSNDGILYNKLQDSLIKCPEGKTGAVSIPNSVTTIESFAFGLCKGLTSVTIPNSVTTIGFRAFYDCTGLTNLLLEDGTTTLSELSVYTFENCPIENLYFGRNISYEDYYSPFYNKTTLTTLIIGNSMQQA